MSENTGNQEQVGDDIEFTPEQIAAVDEAAKKNAADESGLDIAVALDHHLDSVTTNVSDDDYSIPDTSDSDQPTHTGKGWSWPKLKMGLAIGGSLTGIVVIAVILILVLRKK